MANWWISFCTTQGVPPYGWWEDTPKALGRTCQLIGRKVKQLPHHAMNVSLPTKNIFCFYVIILVERPKRIQWGLPSVIECAPIMLHWVGRISEVIHSAVDQPRLECPSSGACLTNLISGTLQMKTWNELLQELTAGLEVEGLAISRIPSPLYTVTDNIYSRNAGKYQTI